ncbi:ABC-type nitrate/sulfonate/bicarbonate transport system permease component [Paenibacillus forsythiae]|uniref:ABC-type nitrate/sulfonate/bicarbonate transport system permease component n=1 Tax=Paenibacillus forsythiae TaxID=365616 RepID=A0ABU3HBJ1_9BACL|nr:ABC transporter permease [Paenibacillus forsythiae]MDT3428183.1 ABC-type nitrate/sulfonate/bicarbonate transport system permease component [Paenibacillus forsythiae]
MISRWKQIWPPLVAVIFFLALWQLSVSWFGIEQWFLPAPTDIWREGVASASSLKGHTLATLRLTLTGFPLGVAAGLICAVLLHIVPWTARALYPLLILSQNVPVIALGPLLVIWFGFGQLPKIILIVLVCFFPVAVAGLGGLAQTDRLMLQFMKMAGATRRQIFTKLELPHALPSLFSGIKISAAYAVTGAVVAELIGGDKGLGYYMQLQKSAYRTDRMFVAIILIVLLSLLLFAAVALLEKWLVRWKPQRDA